MICVFLSVLKFLILNVHFYKLSKKIANTLFDKILENLIDILIKVDLSK